MGECRRQVAGGGDLDAFQAHPVGHQPQFGRQFGGRFGWRMVLGVGRQHTQHAGGPVGQTLVVRFDSLETPDLFKDGAEVVVEGELAGGATPVFHATKVLAKCPSKFRPQEPATASF